MNNLEKDKNIWLIVCDNKNWDIAVERGIFGVDSAPGRIKSVKQGDIYVIYIKKIGFVGWGDITGSYYIGKERFWGR